MEKQLDSLMDIRYHGGNESAYRLRGCSIDMKATVASFEPDGNIKEVKETTTHELSKERMRVRGARKQTAARSVRPVASVTIVKKVDVLPVEQTIQRLTTIRETEEIALLDMQIKQLRMMLSMTK